MGVSAVPQRKRLKFPPRESEMVGGGGNGMGGQLVGGETALSLCRFPPLGMAPQEVHEILVSFGFIRFSYNSVIRFRGGGTAPS